jgi:3-hydroxybutyryl-CoA dehydrogenase
MAAKDRNRIGLVGLGLMGRGIATCLLGHGYEVVAYNRTRSRAQQARQWIAEHLKDAVSRKIFRASQVKDWEERFRIVYSCSGLHDCPFIVESVKEDVALKNRIYDELEDGAAPDVVIASNTSSIPVTVLQEDRTHPERMLVMHWAEPAWISRFMEIVRNEATSPESVRRAEAVCAQCDKQPSVLNFDVRGFIANRLMYAFIREACYLADLGVADTATIDRSFQNDTGWWSALAGPFRWMDLTGIHSYGLVMKDLLPDLCNSGEMPSIMQKMITTEARGISNKRGFYSYDDESAAAWEEAWIDFTYDMRKLMKKYEARLPRPASDV